MFTTDGEEVEIGGKHHFTKEFDFKDSLISTLLYFNVILFLFLIVIFIFFQFDIGIFEKTEIFSIKNDVKLVLIQILLNYLLIYIIKKINF